MSAIHTSGYYFEVENFNGWNNGVSRFHYVHTINTDEHVYSFNYNASANYTPSTTYETIYFKPGQGWNDLSSTSNPYSLTTTNGVTEGTNSSGSVMMKWGHSGFPDPTISTSGGGTSTEEVLVENAQMLYYGGITGWRFEQRGYAAGSYQLIGGTVNESWTVSNGSNNLQHHISQIPANGTYSLYFGSNIVATLSTTSLKKVFCNFW